VKTVSARRILVARIIAVCGDAVQIGFPYLFGEGCLSPLDNILDVVMCVTLTLLVGWHHAFIPSFLVELLPFGDLAPTWTLATLFATRSRQPPASGPEQKPPGLPGPGQELKS
jgi:hypothetical protein